MKRRWELCPKIGSEVCAHILFTVYRFHANDDREERTKERVRERSRVSEECIGLRMHTRIISSSAHCAPCAYNCVFKASHIGWIWFVHWTFHHHSILFSCPFSRNGKSVQDHMHAPYCEYRVHAFNFRFLFALFFLRSFSAWFIRISRAQRIQSCSISLELIREKLKMDSKLLKPERTGEKRKHTFEHI